MVTIIKLTHPSPHIVTFYVCAMKYVRSTLCKFHIYNRVLLATVTMPYFRALELSHLMTESLYLENNVN